MALIKCPECGGQVSNTAGKCPHCGAKTPKKTSLVTWVVAGIAGLVMVNMLTRPSSPTPPTKTPEQLAAEKKREQDFQVVVIAVRLVKSKVKSPESFQLKYVGMSEAGAVCIEYSAVNSFNARVQEFYTVAPKTSGNSAELWNAHCAKRKLTDFSYARQAI